jgi:beta-RFAP synthase
MKKSRCFDPGGSILTRGLKKRIQPVREHVEIRFPARVHITLIDSNRFDFGKPGAGGMGFALRMDNRMDVFLTDEDYQDAPDESVPLIAHITALMKKVFDYRGGIGVKLHTHEFFRPHKGLGYTTTILTSCAWGLNGIFGLPLSIEEVRDLVAHNYAEVSGGRLIRGMETGVGTHLALRGGFVVVGGDLSVIYARRFFPSYQVILVDPGAVRMPHKEAENVSIMEKIFKEDEAFRYHKSYLVLMDLIPALYRENFETIGDIIWRFQFGGNNLLEGEKYKDGGRRLVDVMHALRLGQKPRPIVSISAVGPIMFAVSKNVGNLEKVCDELGVRFFTTQVDNEGLKLLKD